MSKFYSATLNSFYPRDLRERYIRAGTWPADAVEVTGAEWRTYGQGEPPAGMRRGADESGRPAWVPAPPTPPYVPQQVTRRQGRLALLETGYLDQVETEIDGIEDPAQRTAARIEYEADTWERSNAFLQQMWADLGGTPEELDDLFVLAATK